MLRLRGDPQPKGIREKMSRRQRLKSDMIVREWGDAKTDVSAQQALGCYMRRHWVSLLGRIRVSLKAQPALASPSPLREETRSLIVTLQGLFCGCRTSEQRRPSPARSPPGP